MSKDIFEVTAGTRDKVIAESIVFNLSETEYMLHIKIPTKYIHSYSLVGIHECDSTEDLMISGLVEHKSTRPWIDIPFGILNQKVGLHVYKIELLDLYNDEPCHVFFAYRIQNDNPDKPYIYMDNARRFLNQ